MTEAHAWGQSDAVLLLPESDEERAVHGLAAMFVAPRPRRPMLYPSSGPERGPGWTWWVHPMARAVLTRRAFARWCAWRYAH